MYVSYPTKDHKEFKENVRAFIEKGIVPNLPSWEAQGLFPDSLFKQAARYGLLGIEIPVEWDGLGKDAWYSLAAWEELGDVCFDSIFLGLGVHSMTVVPMIHKYGSDFQKSEFVRPSVRGQKIGALGVTEPLGIGNWRELETVAKKSGSYFILNGRKKYITNGSRAHFIVTLAVTNSERGINGLSFFVVPKGTPGFKVERRLDTLGHSLSDTAELSFTNCKIPEKLLLGKEGSGFHYFSEFIQRERLAVGAGVIVKGDSIIRQTVAWLKSRKSRGGSLADFQALRHRLAEMKTEIEALRYLVYAGCSEIVENGSSLKLTSMIKLKAGSLINQITKECLQMHGGFGYLKDCSIGKAMLAGHLISIGGGTAEAMKEIISNYVINER